jgi:hypothetical protein
MKHRVVRALFAGMFAALLLTAAVPLGQPGIEWITLFR